MGYWKAGLGRDSCRGRGFPIGVLPRPLEIGLSKACASYGVDEPQEDLMSKKSGGGSKPSVRRSVANNAANQKNANIGTPGTNRAYSQVHGNRGTQMAQSVKK